MRKKAAKEASEEDRERADAAKAIDQIRRFHALGMVCSNLGCPCTSLEKKLELIVAAPRP